MPEVRRRDSAGGGSEQLTEASLPIRDESLVLRCVGEADGGEVSCGLDVASANRVGSGSAQCGGAKALVTKTNNNAVKTRTSISNALKIVMIVSRENVLSWVGGVKIALILVRDKSDFSFSLVLLPLYLPNVNS